MLLPFLTESDPQQTSEGSLDPLGLYPIADALAVRLCPGVRERQSYPRFLTAMAVSAAVCEVFDDDRLASDEVTTPRQVFEWYVVEGLVRSATDSDSIRGLPGREKARAAMADGVPISADRYLKTPSVFGFHGVYRLLAHTLGVEIGDALGEFGDELVSIWADEQGLPGFIGTRGGAGSPWRTHLRNAVSDGLDAGHVARKKGWRGWHFFGMHLAPHDIGKAEADCIRTGLLRAEDGYRAETLQHLTSTDGQAAWLSAESERDFHHFLGSRVSEEQQSLLSAISTYETFSRLLQDAFDDCRLYMSRNSRQTTARDLSALAGVTRAARELPKLSESLAVQLEPVSEHIRFSESFDWTLNAVSPLDWVVLLLDHHHLNQQRKPPAGKAPWVEQHESGRYLIRPSYRVEEGGKHDDSYVHAYRTRPLWSFAQELGMTGG